MPEGWGFCILTRACYWGHAIHRSHRSRTKGSVHGLPVFPGAPPIGSGYCYGTSCDVVNVIKCNHWLGEDWESL